MRTGTLAAHRQVNALRWAAYLTPMTSASMPVSMQPRAGLLVQPKGLVEEHQHPHTAVYLLPSHSGAQVMQVTFPPSPEGAQADCADQAAATTPLPPNTPKARSA